MIQKLLKVLRIKKKDDYHQLGFRRLFQYDIPDTIEEYSAVFSKSGINTAAVWVLLLLFHLYI